MGNLWEKAKAHPGVTAMIVFGVGLLFVILLFGGNKSGGSTVVAPVAADSDSSAATALQMANLNASVQTNATNAALQAALAGTAAQVTDSNNNASVNLANIYASADTTKYVADLGAKVALDTNSATKAINDANVSGAVQIATIQTLADQNIASLVADAQNKQTTAAVTIAGLNNQLGNVQAGYNYQLGTQQIAANLNQANTKALYDFQNYNNALNVQYGLGIHAIDVASAVAQATGQQYSVQGGR